jgi:hypothetical protein
LNPCPPWVLLHLAAAWACGTLDNGYGKKTNVCAPATCNAQQRNLGGDLLVLDTDSFNQPMQGYNKPIPATCCQACQDTDGCNAWVLCTKQVRGVGATPRVSSTGRKGRHAADMWLCC